MHWPQPQPCTQHTEVIWCKLHMAQGWFGVHAARGIHTGSALHTDSKAGLKEGHRPAPHAGSTWHRCSSVCCIWYMELEPVHMLKATHMARSGSALHVVTTQDQPCGLNLACRIGLWAWFGPQSGSMPLIQPTELVEFDTPNIKEDGLCWYLSLKTCAPNIIVILIQLWHGDVPVMHKNVPWPTSMKRLFPVREVLVLESKIVLIRPREFKQAKHIFVSF